MSLKDAILDLFGFVPPEPRSPRARPSTPKSRPSPSSTRDVAPASASPSPHTTTGAAPSSSTSTEGEPRRREGRAGTAAAARQGASGARSEAEVLAAVNRGGGPFREVVFTNNRRVMASLAGGGSTLRLNAAFASAPDEVLAAVGTLFSTRDGRKRNTARGAVRAFISGLPANPAPPRRRKRRVYVEDVAHLARLQAEFDRVNAAAFDGALPRCPLYLSGKMRRRNGHFSAHPLEIVISLQLCQHAAPGESEATLRHEMIHLWQHATGRPVDHGMDFRRMARRLDVHPRATRAVQWRNGQPPRRRKPTRS